MKHISILIPKGNASIVNIEGSRHIFSEANNFLRMMGRPEMFKVQFVGIGPASTAHGEGEITIRPDVMIADVRKTDLILIPAIHGPLDRIRDDNREFLAWIVQQYKGGAEVASFCIGTFFLASTGLLAGRNCSTHWNFANEFRAMFPEANLMDDKIMTEDSGLYTSGGAYSYLNLVVYLVEKYAGREIAIMIAKAFMIDIDRYSQSPFIMFTGQKAHDDEQIKKAQEYIESNYQEKITVDQLADMLALGRRSLERRFKKATCNTLTEYIQRVKIEAAKKGFESSRKNINEVMYEVGYSDTKAFRTVFKKITGLSPIDYRNKYNKEMAA